MLTQHAYKSSPILCGNHLMFEGWQAQSFFKCQAPLSLEIPNKITVQTSKKGNTHTHKRKTEEANQTSMKGNGWRESMWKYNHIAWFHRFLIWDKNCNIFIVQILYYYITWRNISVCSSMEMLLHILLTKEHRVEDTKEPNTNKYIQIVYQRYKW